MLHTLWDTLFGKAAAKRKLAVAIDLETGVLEACPVCRTIADKQVDENVLTRADAVVDRLFAENAPEVAVFNGDAQALKKQLRDVRKRYGYLCACENN